MTTVAQQGRNSANADFTKIWERCKADHYNMRLSDGCRVQDCDYEPGTPEHELWRKAYMAQWEKRNRARKVYRLPPWPVFVRVPVKKGAK